METATILDLIGNFGAPLVFAVCFGYLLVKLFTIYREDSKQNKQELLQITAESKKELIEQGEKMTTAVNNLTNTLDKLSLKIVPKGSDDDAN